MHSPKKDAFVKAVSSKIKFSLDREEIRDEIETHFEDRYYYELNKGLSADEALDKTLSVMGDPDEIGSELNKVHSPIIGWLSVITSVIKVILIVFSVFTFGSMAIISLFSTNGINNIPEDEIIYHLEIDEVVYLDDRTIKYTDIIYDKDNNIHIFSKNYDKKLWGTGWSLGSMGVISDDLGNEYFSGGSSSSAGIITKSHRRLNDFSEDANELIITYDNYNRYYQIIIPLGRSNE